MGRFEHEDMMLMPIGRFARASRLSVKSLRNYDESGLLKAAHVDSNSGYRYYRLEQLAAADVIRSLRALDVSLPQIGAILAGDQSMASLASHLVALKEHRDAYDRKLQNLQRLIDRKEFVMSESVTIKSVPALLVASYRTATTQRQVFADIPAGFGRVMDGLGAAGVDPTGAPFTIFFQTPDSDSTGDIGMCIPLSSTRTAVAGVDVVQVPEATVASILHRGAYEEMGDSYATISAWIHRFGHRIAGPTREIYLNSLAEVDRDGLLTEIQFPIDPEAEEGAA